MFSRLFRFYNSLNGRSKRKHAKFYVAVIFVSTVVLMVYYNVQRRDVRRIVHDWPKNYVYNKKRPQLHLNERPGLAINYTDTVFINETQSLAEIEENLFRYLEKKQVLCDKDLRLGNQHEGGWNVCLSPPFQLTPPCLVYAFGIGDDWRFEDDIADVYKCKVLAFDPSIPLLEHNRTDLIHYKPLGLGAWNGKSPEGWRLNTLATHLLMEGHDSRVVDYVKFDIEYMEWDVLRAMVEDGSLKSVKQLAFEIHMTRLQKHPRGDPEPITKNTFLQMYTTLQLLEEINFRMFNYRLNPFCNYVSNATKRLRTRCYELHYVNMNFVLSNHFKGFKENVSTTSA